MEPTRAVRIPVRRPAAPPPSTPAPPTTALPTPAPLPVPSSEVEPEGAFEPNRGGTMRGYRTFVIFLTATVAVFLVLLVQLLTSPAPGVRDDPLDYGLVTVLGLGIIIASYVLALLPAPRGVLRKGRELVVIERSGQVRRLRSEPEILRPVVVKRFRAERPGEDFTISIRVNINANNVGGMRDALRAYSDAGIQHVMAAPEDRDIDTYLATAEAFRRAGEGL